MWVIQATGKWDGDTQQTAHFMETFHGEITEDMLAGFLTQVGLVQPGKSSRELPQWNYWVPFRNSLRMNPFVVSHQDDVERLKKFESPTLLVKGTGSTAWLHQIIEGLAENMPQSWVVEFPSGHAPISYPENFFCLNWKSFRMTTHHHDKK
jgi:pimeloyl-ACP methyl ester carboxylesterase